MTVPLMAPPWIEHWYWKVPALLKVRAFDPEVWATMLCDVSVAKVTSCDVCDPLVHVTVPPAVMSTLAGVNALLLIATVAADGKLCVATVIVDVAVRVPSTVTIV